MIPIQLSAASALCLIEKRTSLHPTYRILWLARCSSIELPEMLDAHQVQDSWPDLTGLLVLLVRCSQPPFTESISVERAMLARST